MIDKFKSYWIAVPFWLRPFLGLLTLVIFIALMPFLLVGVLGYCTYEVVDCLIDEWKQA